MLKLAFSVGMPFTTVGHREPMAPGATVSPWSLELVMHALGEMVAGGAHGHPFAVWGGRIHSREARGGIIPPFPLCVGDHPPRMAPI